MEGGKRGRQGPVPECPQEEGKQRSGLLPSYRKLLCLLCEAGLCSDSPLRRTSSLPVGSMAECSCISSCVEWPMSLSQGSQHACGIPSLLIHTPLLCPCPPGTPFTVPRSAADGNDETNLTAIHPPTCSQPSALIQQTFSMPGPCVGC